MFERLGPLMTHATTPSFSCSALKRERAYTRVPPRFRFAKVISNATESESNDAYAA
jgi:hypothetical protein